MKGSELIQVGHDFCSTLITMINSKILKRKFTVDTSLNHLYQMNQKAFKKQFSMISSKDDPSGNPLCGFTFPVDAPDGHTKDAPTKAKDHSKKDERNHHEKDGHAR